MLSEKLTARFKVSNTAHDRILVAEACSLEAKLQAAEAEVARLKGLITARTRTQAAYERTIAEAALRWAAYDVWRDGDFKEWVARGLAALLGEK